MGKGQKRRSPKKEEYPPEARFVCDMLSGNTNPLVSLTFVGPLNPISGKLEYPRSMGFIVERFEGGMRLVATCKHAVKCFSMPSYQKVVAFKNPRPTMLTVLGDPLEDPEPEHDVAFFLVRDPLNAPTKPFALHTETLPITPGQILYNAQNRCDPFKRMYDVFVASQQVREREQIVFCKLTVKQTHSIPRGDQERQRALEQEGWIGYPLLQMVSRPGYSGSPIWDNGLRLHGMDIRGSTPEDSFHADTGDVTVSLPTRVLFEARQRIDPLLQQRLARFA